MHRDFTPRGAGVLSEDEIVERYGVELELFAEHAERLAELVGVRSEMGSSLAKIAHAVSMMSLSGPGDER